MNIDNSINEMNFASTLISSNGNRILAYTDNVYDKNSDKYVSEMIDSAVPLRGSDESIAAIFDKSSDGPIAHFDYLTSPVSRFDNKFVINTNGPKDMLYTNQPDVKEYQNTTQITYDQKIDLSEYLIFTSTKGKLLDIQISSDNTSTTIVTQGPVTDVDVTIIPKTTIGSNSNFTISLPNGTYSNLLTLDCDTQFKGKVGEQINIKIVCKSRYKNDCYPLCENATLSAKGEKLDLLASGVSLGYFCINESSYNTTTEGFEYTAKITPLVEQFSCLVTPALRVESKNVNVSVGKSVNLTSLYSQGFLNAFGNVKFEDCVKKCYSINNNVLTGIRNKYYSVDDRGFRKVSDYYESLPLTITLLSNDGHSVRARYTNLVQLYININVSCNLQITTAHPSVTKCLYNDMFELVDEDTDTYKITLFMAPVDSAFGRGGDRTIPFSQTYSADGNVSSNVVKFEINDSDNTRAHLTVKNVNSINGAIKFDAAGIYVWNIRMGGFYDIDLTNKWLNDLGVEVLYAESNEDVHSFDLEYYTKSDIIKSVNSKFVAVKNKQVTSEISPCVQLTGDTTFSVRDWSQFRSKLFMWKTTGTKGVFTVRIESVTFADGSTYNVINPTAFYKSWVVVGDSYDERVKLVEG